FPALLSRQVRPAAGRERVRAAAVEVVADDRDHGRGRGVVHRGGGHGQVVREAFGDHDIGGQAVALNGRVKIILGEVVELGRGPEAGLIAGVPVRLVLGGYRVKVNAVRVLDGL